MEYPNFMPGMIYKFNCCCEGKGVIFDSPKNLYLNQDGKDMNSKNEHYFIILSSKIRSNKEEYVTAVPITSSQSGYNLEMGESLKKEMVNEKAEFLANNNSIIKVANPTRIFKGHLKKDDDGVYEYAGFIYDRALPEIVNKIAKHMG